MSISLAVGSSPIIEVINEKEEDNQKISKENSQDHGVQEGSDGSVEVMTYIVQLQLLNCGIQEEMQSSEDEEEACSDEE